MDRQPDRAAVLASLRERWGAATPRPATEVFGALAVVPRPATNPPTPLPLSDSGASNHALVVPRPRPAPAATDRTIPTGFPALDALLAAGGLPRAGTVALDGAGSSGATTLALRVLAEAQVGARSPPGWTSRARSIPSRQWPAASVLSGSRSWSRTGSARRSRWPGRCSRRARWTSWCWTWGQRTRGGTWETPILAQVSAIQLDTATIAGVVAALGSTQRPVAIDRARLERQMRELALDHVAGGIGDDAYLARLAELRSQLAAVDEGSSLGVPAERAVAWLRALGETWNHADVPQQKADLLHAIYERIVVAGPTFVSARLTSPHTPTAWRWRSRRLLWRPRQWRPRQVSDTR